MWRFGGVMLVAGLVLACAVTRANAQTSDEALRNKIQQLQQHLNKLQALEKEVQQHLETAKKQYADRQEQYVIVEVAGTLKLQTLTLTTYPAKYSHSWRVVSRNTLWILDLSQEPELAKQLNHMHNGERIIVKGKMTALRPAQRGEITGIADRVKILVSSGNDGSDLPNASSPPTYGFVGTLKVSAITVGEYAKHAEETIPPQTSEPPTTLKLPLPLRSEPPLYRPTATPHEVPPFPQ